MRALLLESPDLVVSPYHSKQPSLELGPRVERRSPAENADMRVMQDIVGRLAVAPTTAERPSPGVGMMSRERLADIARR
jgi:hypothetical protein